VKFKDQLHDVRVANNVPGTEESEEVKERQIIRSEAYFPKPMTAEEAALQLEAIEKDFLVFVDADTDLVSIIYRRNDGNFGLIEPRR